MARTARGGERAGKTEGVRCGVRVPCPVSETTALNAATQLASSQELLLPFDNIDIINSTSVDWDSRASTRHSSAGDFLCHSLPSRDAPSVCDC